MKILVISHLFPNAKNRNSGIFVARQLEEMGKQGMDISVIVPMVWTPSILRKFKRWKDYDHNAPLLNFKSVKTYAVPYLRITGNWFYRWSGLSVFWAIRKLASKLHRKQLFDIIYAHSFFPEGDAAVRLGKALKLPVVCVGIGGDINIIPNHSRAMYKRFAKVANDLNGAMACGKVLADKINAVSNKKTLSVYGVVDLKRFSPVKDKRQIRRQLGLSEDKLLFLYLSNLKKDKGVYELLNVFLQIAQEKDNVELCICGDGVEESGMLGFIKERDQQNSMRMMGFVDPEQVDLWMKACDLFVLPSYHEGMPNVVMEAMACGMPVIASAVGGLPEAVGDCEGALLVPAKDTEALKKAMRLIIDDENTRYKMGHASRNRAQERFGVETTVRTVIDYLTKVKNEFNS